MATGGIADIWKGLQGGSRASLLIGAALVALLAVAGVIWSMQPDYRVLFSSLTEADAAAIVTELKRTKAEYRLTDGGTTIRVPADRVYETRLALMSSGAPLAGGVGFEIFDKQGLGATEQSQRVSYQRALQGELARTIGALEHVRQARVLLALPESSLFRKDRQEPRAAVSLILQPGASLEREQIAGIQRLVAASVAGLDPARVVVTDQRGVTLSGADALEGPGGVGAGRLAMKREIEEYFTHKIADLLESAFGPGQVIVSVDVALNFDEIHRTVQDLLPPPAVAGGTEAGVRHKRQVVTGNPTPDNSVNADSGDGSQPHAASTSTDVEYEYGRRVEQVVSSPGSIEQMTVGVVVRGDLSGGKEQRITQLVRMAAGLNEHRGDAVTVEALGVSEAHATTSPAQASAAAPPAPAAVARGSAFPPINSRLVTLGLAALLCLGLLAAALVAFLRSRATLQPLTADERNRLLRELEQTLAAPVPVVQRRAS